MEVEEENSESQFQETEADRQNLLLLQEKFTARRMLMGLNPPEGLDKEFFTCCFGIYCLNRVNKFPGLGVIHKPMRLTAPLFELHHKNKTELVNFLQRKKTANCSDLFLKRIRSDPRVRLFACNSHFIHPNNQVVTLGEALRGVLKSPSTRDRRIGLHFKGLTHKKAGDVRQFLARLNNLWADWFNKQPDMPHTANSQILSNLPQASLMESREQEQVEEMEVVEKDKTVEAKREVMAPTPESKRR